MNTKPYPLFVYGRNQWRSPAAVRVYANDPRGGVRSAAVSAQSRHPITRKDIEWADLILVMKQIRDTQEWGRADVTLSTGSR